MSDSEAWEKIYNDCKLFQHDFAASPYLITAKQIKNITTNFSKTSQKEVRLLCKQDTRESRPRCFIENNLFILPIKNGEYFIIKGNGYIDIPEISNTEEYVSKLDFTLDTSAIGNSEMQHLDFAYASSLIRSFMGDDSLVLTIRGRKYTPEFKFNVGQHNIEVKSVQTEVDAGYEGRDKIVLIEAKNSNTKNTIIRQLYYPYRQWSSYTKKKIINLFFERKENIYSLWEYQFSDENNYNSIKLKRAAKYIIK